MREQTGADYVEPLLSVYGEERTTGITTRGGDEETFGLAENEPRWSLNYANVPAAWQSLKNAGRPDKREAQGVLVAHIDTGYTTHPEMVDEAHPPVLTNRGYNYLNNSDDAKDPRTSTGTLKHPGHGTAAGSVIVSPDGCQLPGKTKCATGSGRGAQLIPIRLNDSVVNFSQAKLSHALFDIAEGRRGPGIQAISLAMGGPPSLSLWKATRAVEKKGILLFAAAGNYVQTVVWPARFDAAIAVSAINPACRPWRHASHGSAVDISAPGQGVWRATFQGEQADVGMGAGTTFATGTMAGVGALWLAHHRDSPQLAQLRADGELTATFRRLAQQTSWRPDVASDAPSGVSCSQRWDTTTARASSTRPRCSPPRCRARAVSRPRRSRPRCRCMRRCTPKARPLRRWRPISAFLSAARRRTSRRSRRRSSTTTPKPKRCAALWMPWSPATAPLGPTMARASRCWPRIFRRRCAPASTLPEARMRPLILLAGLFAAGAIPAQTPEPPKRYALVVGIDRYLDRDLWLQYAVADAKAMSDVLSDHEYDVVMMPDDDASRSRLIRELTGYAQRLQPQDTFVLFLAGHGMRNAAAQEVYWLPYDADISQPDVSGIRIRHLIDYLDDIPARQKIVILDHCYSGEIGEALASVEPGARSGSYGAPSIPRDAFPVEDVRASIDRGATGTFVATAARGLAREDPQDGHGLMTWALLQAVKTGDADVPDSPTRPSDGALSIHELKRYLYQTVKEVSRTRGFDQRPIADVYGPDNSIAEQEWKPFLRALNAAERAAFAERYRSKLLEWRTGDYINESVRKSAEDAIAEWAADATSYTAEQRRIVFVLRDTIDSSPLLDVQKASEVSRRVSAIVNGGGS